jgi:DNA-binding NarL/FixJ family response regulator
MPDLRILIADDHPLIRRGVRDLLSLRADWKVVGEAGCGAEAVQQAVRLEPDVAVLDFSMPELNGSQAAALICRKLPGTAVVVLTMHDSDEIIHQVLRSGARGLVLKSEADRMLLGAVEAVSERRNHFTDRASRMIMGRYMGIERSARAAEPVEGPHLTKREEELLRLLAGGMTNKDAASRLQISVRTVESHRINMSRKLGFNSIADLVRYAIRNGMVAQC